MLRQSEAERVLKKDFMLELRALKMRDSLKCNMMAEFNQSVEHNKKHYQIRAHASRNKYFNLIAAQSLHKSAMDRADEEFLEGREYRRNPIIPVGVKNSNTDEHLEKVFLTTSLDKSVLDSLLSRIKEKDVRANDRREGVHNFLKKYEERSSKRHSKKNLQNVICSIEKSISHSIANKKSQRKVTKMDSSSNMNIPTLVLDSLDEHLFKSYAIHSEDQNAKLKNEVVSNFKNHEPQLPLENLKTVKAVMIKHPVIKEDYLQSLDSILMKCKNLSNDSFSMQRHIRETGNIMKKISKSKQTIS